VVCEVELNWLYGVHSRVERVDGKPVHPTPAGYQEKRHPSGRRFSLA
jgi:hypothetical protein